MLIEPIGRAEEQIALQRHALNLPAVIGQERQFVRATIERRAVFRAVEIEFDGVDAARAQRKGGATDHDPDQHAGDKARIDDQDRDGDQRQIFDQQQAPRRQDQPLIDEVGAEIEQEPAENIFRHIAEKRRTGEQHGRRDRSHGHAADTAGGAGGADQHRPAERGAAHIAAQRRDRDIGKPEHFEIAFDIGFAPSRDLEPGRVEQEIRNGHENDCEHVARERWQRRPREALQGCEFPRRRQAGRRLQPEQPAVVLCDGDWRAGREQHQICHRERGQQHARQDDRIFGATQQHIEGDCDDHAGGDLGPNRGVAEGSDIGERRSLIRDDLDRAGDQEPTGRAEESANDRVGHKSDCTPRMGEAEYAEQ